MGVKSVTTKKLAKSYLNRPKNMLFNSSSGNTVNPFVTMFPTVTNICDNQITILHVSGFFLFLFFSFFSYLFDYKHVYK